MIYLECITDHHLCDAEFGMKEEIRDDAKRGSNRNLCVRGDCTSCMEPFIQSPNARRFRPVTPRSFETNVEQHQQQAALSDCSGSAHDCPPLDEF
jgi:hypothetical protein